MNIFSQGNKTIKKTIYIGIIVIISAVFTVFSMETIKNVPGTSFSTEMDYYATALLVFGLWALGLFFCIWLVGFLANLIKSGNSLPSAKMSVILEKKSKDLKILVALRKIVIGILNVAYIYFYTMLSGVLIAFSGLGGLPTGILMVLAVVDVCIVLPLFAVAVSNIITTIMLKCNPYNKRAIDNREKEKKALKILSILCICFPLLVYICALLFKQ